MLKQMEKQTLICRGWKIRCLPDFSFADKNINATEKRFTCEIYFNSLKTARPSLKVNQKNHNYFVYFNSIVP